MTVGRSWRLATAFAVVAAIAAMVAPAPAQAVSLIVNTTADELNSDGDCSLREAIQAANTDSAVDACPAGSGADTITFSVTGTIAVTSTLPTITTVLAIAGPGASNLTISGGGSVLVIDVESGTLDLSNVTIASGAGYLGGGIYNHLGGTVKVANSVFSGNSSAFGGGISNEATLMVTSSTFSGNSATYDGGGIFNQTGDVTVTSSTFSGNFGGEGGGIGGCGWKDVSASTFSGNSAYYGGALGNCSTLIVTNSTLVGNSAFNYGGGIWNTAYLTLTNDTLAGNSAGINGGGVANNYTATFLNTIVANSTSPVNCVGLGTFTDGGGNLSWPDTSCPGINQDPTLGSLANNGGPTQTMALPAGSPAVDAAVLANCPSTDQRGVARPQPAGGACDIGAFELVQTIPVAVDIKPGETPNVISLGKNSVIPVAVLSTATFYAATVNPATVCFGDAEAPAQRDCTVAPGTVLQDVNKDKRKDLILHFETQQTGIDPGDTRACLSGKLYDNTSIEGCDSIKTK